MKHLKTSLLAAAFALASLTAHATTFDFAYSFDAASNPDNIAVVMTGSFSGTLVGDTITGISDIHAAMNGTAVSGQMFALAFDPDTQSWIAPVISTDVAKSNFSFVDGNLAVDPGNYTTMFTISGGEAFAVNANVITVSNNFLVADETANNGHWRVTVSAVPEPSTYALLISGIGLIGFVAQRRRQA